MMRRVSDEGKCGLLALLKGFRRGSSVSLRAGRTPLDVSLDTTMMRRMIGRYKGFRCAGMVAGVKVDRQRRW